MYDIIIPLSNSHINQLEANLYFIETNLKYDKLIIICKKNVYEKINLSSLDKINIEYMDEDTLGNSSFSRIKELIIKKKGDTKRTGWYFQQFLKMQYSLICKKNYYLIWDADTIPLSKIDFFSLDGKMLFNRKKEHHLPYFETIDVLFSKSLKYEEKSFITEGMIIECNIMKALIKEIQENKSLIGEFWDEKIINAINEKDISKSGFSEFETYGTYLINKYPEKYQERPLRTLRNGMSLYGKIPSREKLLNLDLDTISFENWDRGFWNKLKDLIKFFVINKR